MKFLIIRNFQTKIVMSLRKSFEIGGSINLGDCIRAKEHLMGGGKEEMCTHMVDTKTENVDMA